MSIEIVHQRLSTAFTDKTPRVILLTGGWGEGKTYQWRQALKRSRELDRLSSCAYVSLFGVGSLADIRKRLTEEFVAAIPVSGEKATVGSKIAGFVAERKPFQINKLLPLIPYLGKAESLLNELSFAVVRDAVICIDDLERKGKSLPIADVLGLASFLKEERNCRVVLIANEKKFDDEDIDAKQRFSEKVIDEHVHFEPTVQEACDIAQGLTPTVPALMLRRHLIELKVANIRVIGRLNRLAEEMSSAVRDLNERVLEIGVLAVTMFGLGHLIPDERFPSIDFICNREDGGWIRYAIQGKSRGSEPPTDQQKQEEQWEALLSQFGGPGTDPFELAIASSVRQGYLSPELRQRAKALENRLKDRQLGEAYREAWVGFWHSLQGTGDELLNSLRQVTLAAIHVIGPGDLRAAYDAFEAAGRTDDVDEMISAFIEANKDRPQIFDRSRSAFPEYFSGKFGERLEAANKHYKVRPTIEKALDGISISAYNADDVAVVADAAPEELERLVRTAPHLKFPTRVRALLALGSMDRENPKAAATSRWFTEALKRWADTDALTAIRLKSYLPVSSSDNNSNDESEPTS